MKRFLLICLSLVLALVGGSAACAEDGFYVIPTMKGNYAPVPKTGQTTSYDQNIPPKDDGALKKGVAWPTPRFTDNNNGTVTDNLTRLIWLKNGNAFGLKTWEQALDAANSLQSGSKAFPDLTDGSKAGDWRLPNVRELQSLVDYGRYSPALPMVGIPFTNILASFYWTSTTYPNDATLAWSVYFMDGGLFKFNKTITRYVWCVRGGQ